VLRQLRFDRQLDAIIASSICIPCDMPYVNNIWMPRSRTDRPRPVPEGATNLGLIGQYVEVPRDIAFTIEYSAARRGKRSISCSSAARRRRRFIRASTIRRRCLAR
jgi:myosin-crossreactive antigen